MAPSTDPPDQTSGRARLFCDANILWPVSLVDLTFRLAEIGYHDVLWTEDLPAELTHVLVDYKGLPQRNAEKFCAEIRRTFPNGEIPRKVYEERIARQVGPDADDHVHFAAAAEGGATIFLTANVADFPDADVHPCVVRRPDEYYCDALADDPELIEVVLDQMQAHLTRRPVTIDDLLDSLERAGCASFAQRVRERRRG